MKASKLLRRFATHLFTLVLGILIAFSGFQILSSQAEPAPANLLAQSQSPSTPANVAAVPAPLSADSFVAAAVNRTGPAVVRIDTEAVVTRRVDPIFDDPFLEISLASA